MPQFYAEILRSPGPHDNSFRLLNNNDPSPSTIAWAKDIGVTATSDGDILTFSGSSPGLGVTWFPGSISSTTYPYLIVRAKAANGDMCAIYPSRFCVCRNSKCRDPYHLMSQLAFNK